MSLHRDDEEGDEVHDEDGPEDRDVEELEEGAAEADERRLRRRVPKLELGQPSDEGAELFVLPRRQRQPVVCKVEIGFNDRTLDPEPLQNYRLLLRALPSPGLSWA